MTTIQEVMKINSEMFAALVAEEDTADELRAELTEMYEELLRSYADWEDVAELRYSEGL